MQPEVIALVLAAAVLHATWHAVIKVGRDRLLTYALISVVAMVPALVVLLFVEPPDPRSWAYLALSGIIHIAYQVFLINTYRFGDLSRTFPIARGTAPVFVALGAAVFAGEIPGAAQCVTLALISIGITSLCVGEGLRDMRGVTLAVATGLVTATYTVIDGLGVRASQSPLAFIAWIYVIMGFPLPLAALIWRREKLAGFLRTSWKPGVMAGLFSILSYGIIVWALSLGAMAPVAALREVSVVIAAIIGATFLREPFGRRRILAACLVAIGVVVSAANF